jgi:hypothetical protein
MLATTGISARFFVVACFLLSLAGAFVPSTRGGLGWISRSGMKSDSEAAVGVVAGVSKPKLSVPLSLDEMVRQAASSMKQAAEQGQTRQIIRILLPRDVSSGDFGTYMEPSSSSSSSGLYSTIVLAPPDESWQGGIMQLYRAAAPTCVSIVRELTSRISSSAPPPFPPRVSEDRSVDESGVDGVGLLKTDDNSVACWIQPTQESVMDYIVAFANKAADSEIVAIVNPQWRMVDDALDTASRGEGFFSGFATFLGGKGGVLKELATAGFKPVYTLEGYVCRGNNVRLLQTFDSDWCVFCERDNGESFVAVGSSTTRPTYQSVEEMLIQSDIGYKYARDIGLQPKL